MWRTEGDEQAHGFTAQENGRFGSHLAVLSERGRSKGSALVETTTTKPVEGFQQNLWEVLSQLPSMEHCAYIRADGEEREVVREAHAELLNTKVYCVVLPVQVTVSLFVSGIANYERAVWF